MAVSTMGLGKDTKWAKAAIYMFGFWTIVTCFVCFEKPDFLNVSALVLTDISIKKDNFNNLNFKIIVNNWNHGSLLIFGSSINKTILSKTPHTDNAIVLTL
jgi:hypothetical protein